MAVHPASHSSSQPLASDAQREIPQSLTGKILRQGFPSHQEQLDLVPLAVRNSPTTPQSLKNLQSPAPCQSLVPIHEATRLPAQNPGMAAQRELPQPSFIGKTVRQWFPSHQGQLALAPLPVGNAPTAAVSQTHLQCPVRGQSLVPAAPASLAPSPKPVPQWKLPLLSSIGKIRQWFLPDHQVQAFDSIPLERLPSPQMQDAPLQSSSQSLVAVPAIPRVHSQNLEVAQREPAYIRQGLLSNSDQLALTPLQIGNLPTRAAQDTPHLQRPEFSQSLVTVPSKTLSPIPSQLQQWEFHHLSTIGKTIRQWFSSNQDPLEFDSLALGNSPIAHTPAALSDSRHLAQTQSSAPTPSKNALRYSQKVYSDWLSSRSQASRQALMVPGVPLEHPVKETPSYSEKAFSEWLSSEARANRQALAVRRLPLDSTYVCTLDDQPLLISIEHKLRPIRNFLQSTATNAWNRISSFYSSMTDQSQNRQRTQLAPSKNAERYSQKVYSDWLSSQSQANRQALIVPPPRGETPNYSEKAFSQWLSSETRMNRQALTVRQPPLDSAFVCSMDDQPWLVSIEQKTRPIRNLLGSLASFLSSTTHQLFSSQSHPSDLALPPTNSSTPINPALAHLQCPPHGQELVSVMPNPMSSLSENPRLNATPYESPDMMPLSPVSSSDQLVLMPTPPRSSPVALQAKTSANLQHLATGQPLAISQPTPRLPHAQNESAFSIFSFGKVPHPFSYSQDQLDLTPLSITPVPAMPTHLQSPLQGQSLVRVPFRSNSTFGTTSRYSPARTISKFAEEAFAKRLPAQSQDRQALTTTTPHLDSTMVCPIDESQDSGLKKVAKTVLTYAAEKVFDFLLWGMQNE